MFKNNIYTYLNICNGFTKLKEKNIYYEILLREFLIKVSRRSLVDLVRVRVRVRVRAKRSYSISLPF